MKQSIIASKTDLITVALRRIDLENPVDPIMKELSSLESISIMPNTSGARNKEEAIRLAKLAKNLTGNTLIKLEVIPNPNHLLPDSTDTLLAAEALTKEGFEVYPYCQADPILTKKLEDVGCVCVMPLAAPIGTNKGLIQKEFLEIIIKQASIPIVIDAGIGAPSHASEAMELGADAVLINTAIATAKNPVAMAQAFYLATQAGRDAYLAGLATQKQTAQASSPLTGFLHD